jgi:hypothetical protein
MLETGFVVVLVPWVPTKSEEQISRYLKGQAGHTCVLPIVSVDVHHDARSQLYGHSVWYLSLILFALFQNKMMVILQGESEGIVRREAAALIKEIYDHHKFLWVLVLSI